MGKEEYAKTLESILNDADTAEQVSGGDFANLDANELTEAERALLSAAAGELSDDVIGFGIPKVEGMATQSFKVEINGIAERTGLASGPKTTEALNFYGLKLEVFKF